MKISAYKSLGSFIATFSKDFKEKEEPAEEASIKESASSSSKPNAQRESDFEAAAEKQETNTESSQSEESEAAKTDEQITEYNNFNYWRNSIPSLEETIDLNEKVRRKKYRKPNYKKVSYHHA